MGKRLTENLSSDYLSAAHRLKPRKTRKRILAYVESYDDVSFWRTLFSEFEDDELYFEVLLPSRTSLMKGKKSVLMNQLGSRLGKSMIACVDSDYDYLLQDTTSTSRYMKRCPYVLQTYAYSIENYLCYAESLHDICVAATLNDRRIFDFVDYMAAYSRIIHPLFVWSVWMYRTGIYSEFSLLDFCAFARVPKFDPKNPEEGLLRMEKKIRKKLRELSVRYSSDVEKVEKLREELLQLGVEPENTYMFVQGHHIHDHVVMRMLYPLCAILRREMEQNIRRYAKHHQQMYNELAGYTRSQEDVDALVHRNSNYKTSPLYQKMRDDVLSLIERIKTESEETC